MTPYLALQAFSSWQQYAKAAETSQLYRHIQVLLLRLTHLYSNA